MAVLTKTMHTPIAHRSTAVIADLMEDFKNRRMYRKTISELQKLTDRELHDLGLSRANIKASAIKAVYGY